MTTRFIGTLIFIFLTIRFCFHARFPRTFIFFYLFLIDFQCATVTFASFMLVKNVGFFWARRFFASKVPCLCHALILLPIQLFPFPTFHEKLNNDSALSGSSVAVRSKRAIQICNVGRSRHVLQGRKVLAPIRRLLSAEDKSCGKRFSLAQP